MVKNWPADAGDTGVMAWEDPLKKEMATHSSILAWRIPWTEEPGGLQSIGLQSQTQLKQRKQTSNWNTNCKIGLNLPTFEKVNLPSSEKKLKLFCVILRFSLPICRMLM